MSAEAGDSNADATRYSVFSPVIAVAVAEYESTTASISPSVYMLLSMADHGIAGAAVFEEPLFLLA